MKPTRSKDGEQRFTFVVRHRAGAYEMTRAVFSILGGVLDNHAQLQSVKLTRKRVLEAAREMFKDGSMQGNLDVGDEQQEAWEWAEERGRRLFPELSSGPLTC